MIYLHAVVQLSVARRNLEKSQKSRQCSKKVAKLLFFLLNQLFSYLKSHQAIKKVAITLENLAFFSPK